MNYRIAIVVCIALGALSGRYGHANLVVNGGFETENLDLNGVPIPPPPGWTVSGNGIAIDSTFPNSGTYDISFGATPSDPNPGVLSQLITTTPAKSYIVSFALMDEAGLPANTFTMSFGGFSQTITGDAAPASYTTQSFMVPGIDILSSSTNLSFLGANDIAAWNLDDVIVVAAAVPEPSTTLLFGAFVTILLLSLRLRRSANR